jgi:hypothetical protein
MINYCETAGELPFGRWLALIGAAAARTSVFRHSRDAAERR